MKFGSRHSNETMRSFWIWYTLHATNAMHEITNEKNSHTELKIHTLTYTVSDITTEKNGTRLATEKCKFNGITVEWVHKYCLQMNNHDPCSDCLIFPVLIHIVTLRNVLNTTLVGEIVCWYSGWHYSSLNTHEPTHAQRTNKHHTHTATCTSV